MPVDRRDLGQPMSGPGLTIGCQTYTWEMLGPAWTGGPEDLLDAIAAGGYAGIEITDRMIGAYAGDVHGFAAALQDRGLALVALAVASASGFTEQDAMAGDVDLLARWTDFIAHFPGAVLSIGSATAVSEGPLAQKYETAAAIYNRAAERGKAGGVDIAIHPSSHHNTLLYSRADYDRLFAMLDEDLVGWVPDTGHILRGHADMLDTLNTHRHRIRYLHLKDVDATGRWAMLGQGVCDVAAVIETASAAPRFNGWLVLEEESDDAAADPAAAVKINRATLRRHGF
jgi:inosose dehydratase